MARYKFTSFSNGNTMQKVRQTINDNFTAAMAKPLDGTSFVDAGSASVSLVAIAANGSTYTMASSRFVEASNIINLTNLNLSGSLNVSGNTTLGDSSDDIILLKGTVSAADTNATFNNVAANNFIGGNISATTGSFTSLYVGGSAYKPFIASSTSPSDTSRLWINTNASVPTLYYHNGSNWVALGAVFG